VDVAHGSVSDAFLDRVDDEVLEVVAVTHIRSKCRFDYGQ
jgi:hypothetical protein